MVRIRREIHDSYRHVSLIFYFFLFIGYGETLPPPVHLTTENGVSPDPGVCYSKMCTETATLILNNMNSTADPCDNFYEYACGNFFKKTEVPDGEMFTNSFIALESKILKQLNGSLRITNSNEKTAYKLVKKLYRSCMDTKRIEATGIKEVDTKMKSIGGWPVVEGNSWNEMQFNWLSATYKLRQLGYRANYLINVQVSADFQNLSKTSLNIGMADFIYDRYSLFGNQQRIAVVNRAYLKYMINVAKAFGAKEKYTNDEMSKVLDFELELFNITKLPENAYDEDDVFTRMSISQLNKKFPSIPWLEFINSQMPTSVTLKDDEMVVVTNTDYFSKLEPLLARTPKRVIANYLMWRVAEASSPFLSEALSVHNYEFSKTVFGSQMRSSNERWKTCVVETKLLPAAISSIYVRDHFNLRSKNDVQDLARRLKEEFTNILQSNDWMGKLTKRRSLAKNNAAKYNIAYPDELLNEQNLEEYYKDLGALSDSYLENVLMISKFNRNKRFEIWRKPTNYFWPEFPDVTQSQALYGSSSNAVYVSAALVQHFFHDDNPMYANYGSLGSIIGHELSHGFNSVGLQFNEKGIFLPLGSSARRSFFQNARCVERQYYNYSTKDGDHVNGGMTRDENLADIAGIKIAYNAYKQWVKEYAEEKKLPGIDKSPNQLFWLSTANMWCTKYRNKNALRNLMSMNFHSPSEFRIVGPFTDIPEFAEDYKCPRGSKMNPLQRCKFW